MSRPMHLIINNVASCGMSEGRFLPCSGVSGRTTSVFACCSHGYHKIQARVEIRGLKCSSRGACASFVCEGRRGPQSSSRQSKNGFSRSRKWLNDRRHSFEDFEEDMLSSKNGASGSNSSTPKHQDNAAPRPREEEVIALFKKVQARLRERATSKEEKKFESSQGQNGSVNSLLNVLRKHSAEQVKIRSNVGGRKKILTLDQLQDGDQDQDNETQSSKFSDMDGTSNNEAQKTNISLLARPPSNFQRRSPVPRVKHQRVSCDDNDDNAVPLSNVIIEKVGDQIGMKPDPEPGHDSQLELDSEAGIVDMAEDDSLDSEQIYGDEHGKDQQVKQHEDFRMLKLSELRILAKSRGLKGFSKMKKAEVLELLTGK
ncbi:hypothetical protein Fmac_030022 [Flemingia macrophylla]|uniref:Rho termination factor N-terminal domain-containing protein n=1 Tax=Flemingia macrophylla TaxID=520843 RepID=A0ABD1LC94_9FABA